MIATTFNAALEGQKLRRFQILLVATVLLVLVIDGIDIQLVSLVAPVILQDWGIDRAAFGPAMAGALAGMAIGVIAGGWLGDHYGRRKTLIAAVLLFGITTIGAAFTRDVASLAALRALGGFGFGAAGPTGLALATEWLPRRSRPHAVAFLSIGTPAGGMFGAFLVMFLLPTHGWPATFIACGLLTLLIALIAALILRESPPYLLAKGRQKEAELAAARVIDGPVSLIAGEAMHPASADGRAAPRFYDAANRRLACGVGLSFFCAAAIAYALPAWAPLMLTERGFTIVQAASAILAYNFASMIGALCSGFANRTLGSRRVLIVTALGLVACLLALAIIVESPAGAPDGTTRTIVILLAGGAGAFASLAIGTLYTMMTMGFPPACRASGIGFGMMMGRLGGIITSFAGGYLLDARDASFWPFFAALIVSAGCVCLGAFVADRHVPSAREERAG